MVDLHANDSNTKRHKSSIKHHLSSVGLVGNVFKCPGERESVSRKSKKEKGAFQRYRKKHELHVNCVVEVNRSVKEL